MAVRLGIDASAGREGAEEWRRAVRLVREETRGAVDQVRELRTAMQEVGRAQSGGQVASIRQVTGAQREAAAAGRQVVAQAREEQRIQAQLAADRVRSAQQQSRADAQRLRTRQQAERAALTALSTLGGENRALAQRIQFENRLRQAVDAGVVTQQRANQLRQQANVQFSTAAVRSRDLRLNMLGLNASVSQLAQLAALSGGRIGLLVGQMNALNAVVRSSAVTGGAAAGGAAAGTAIGAGGILAVLAGLAVPVGATAGLVGLVKVSNDLEVALDEVSAITGIVGGDLDRLTARAIAFASQTTQATEEIATGFKLVASSSPELTENAGALALVTRQAILLAEASGDKLEPSVETLTSALSQFGFGAEQAARVVDVLAAGAKVGAVEIPELGRALARTGAIARSAGVEIEDLVALIETAGKSKQPIEIVETSIRNLLLRLQTSGRLQAGDTLLGTLRELEAQGLSSSEMVKLFGERTITTAQFLLQNLDTFERYQEGVREVGVAATQAEVRLDNLSGAASRAGASWGAFVDALSQTGPISSASDLLQGLVERVGRVGEFLTAAVQGRGEELISELLPLDEIERRIQLLQGLLEGRQGTAVGAVLEKQLESFRQARRTAVEEERAAQESLLGQGLGFGVRTTQGDRSQLLQEQGADLRQLTSELDRNAKAQLAFEALQERINEKLVLGLIPKEEAIRLEALARAATLESTPAMRELITAREREAEATRKQAAAVEVSIQASALEIGQLERLLAAEKLGADFAQEVQRDIEIENALRKANVDATTAQGRALEGLIDKQLEARDALRDLQNQQKQAAQILESIRTPEERLSAFVDQVRELQGVDLLNEDQAARAIEQFEAQQQAATSLGQVLQGVGRIGSSALQSLIRPGTSAKDVLDQLLISAVNLAFQLAVLQPLFGKGGGDSGLLGTLIGAGFQGLLGLAGLGLSGAGTAGSGSYVDPGAYTDPSLYGSFQHGGEFTVGATPTSRSLGLSSRSGQDNRLVSFLARDQERVRIVPPGHSLDGPPIRITVNPPADTETRTVERRSGSSRDIEFFIVRTAAKDARDGGDLFSAVRDRAKGPVR